MFKNNNKNGVAIALGVVFGVAIGVVRNNIALWIGIGIY